MQIRNVLIVGGGTAGWMTATALVKLCPHIKTSLIESKDQPIIGVGESTLGQINDFFALLDLKDEEWMRETGSTYKSNIRFTDFYKKGETWDYPFGKSTIVNDLPHGWMSWFALNIEKPEKFTRDTFARSMNIIGHLAYANKLTRCDKFPFDHDTAYHMDAVKFGQWLRDNRCQEVNHMYGHITGCVKDEHGNIDILYAGSKELKYDLYIDCTGFNSVLLEGIMNVPFKSFHVNEGGCLLNDTAVTCHMPHEQPEIEVTNTTTCTAIDNGWVWDVPLWERSGCGYVHSKDFAKNPEEELYQYLVRRSGKTRADQAKFRTVPFRNGKHEKAWEKNVVAVGLANCFVEPLEATGLLTTHEQIIRICNTLKGREGFVPKVEADMLNLVNDLEIEGFKNFIAAHYAFSARETPYWQTVANDVEYDFTTASLDNLFVKYSSEKHVTYEWSGDQNYNDGLRYIGAGMGFNPLNKHTLKLTRLQNQLSEAADKIELDKAELLFDGWNKAMYHWCDDLPSSYEFQKQTIYS